MLYASPFNLLKSRFDVSLLSSNDSKNSSTSADDSVHNWICSSLVPLNVFCSHCTSTLFILSSHAVSALMICSVFSCMLLKLLTTCRFHCSSVSFAIKPQKTLLAHAL